MPLWMGFAFSERLVSQGGGSANRRAPVVPVATLSGGQRRFANG